MEYMRVNWFSPMPPDKSGIAVYSKELIKHFQSLNISINPQITGNDDVNVYSIGNHPLHNSIYSRMLNKQGIALIHDLNIHDLIYYRTAGRGMLMEYVNYLLNESRISKGDIEQILYTGFPEKYHYFRKYDMITETALSNNYFIVHTDYAKRRILSVNPDARVLRVNHFSAWHERIARDKSRDHVMIGIFGYIAQNRHMEEILNAFARFVANAHRHYSIVIAGSQCGVSIRDEVHKRGLDEYVKIIEYPDDYEFISIMKKCDYGINIRCPHNGEVSGNMIKMMGFGIPAASNRTDACFPEETYFPLDCRSIENDLDKFFHSMENNRAMLSKIGEKASEYIEKQCNANDIARMMEEFILSYMKRPVKRLKRRRSSTLMRYFSLGDRIKILMGRKK